MNLGQKAKDVLAAVTSPKVKLILAEAAARAVIYVPLGVLAVTFIGPITIPALLLSAGEPWTDIEFGKIGAWLQKPNQIAPIKLLVQKVINPALTKAGGSTWWQHVARFLPGLVVGAFVPIPGWFNNIPIITPVIKAVLGVAGIGMGAAWAAAMGGLMFAALPLASKFLTGGLTTVFNKLGMQGIADLHHSEVVVKRQVAKASLQGTVAAALAPLKAAATPSVAAPQASTPQAAPQAPAPAVKAAGLTRRLRGLSCRVPTRLTRALHHSQAKQAPAAPQPPAAAQTPAAPQQTPPSEGRSL
jgi:hypothetical protein